MFKDLFQYLRNLIKKDRGHCVDKKGDKGLCNIVTAEDAKDAQEIPVIRVDWHKAKCRIEVRFGHECTMAKSKQYVNRNIDGDILK